MASKASKTTRPTVKGAYEEIDDLKEKLDGMQKELDESKKKEEEKSDSSPSQPVPPAQSQGGGISVGLPLVLLIIAVFVFVGFVIWAVSGSDGKQAQVASDSGKIIELQKELAVLKAKKEDKPFVPPAPSYGDAGHYGAPPQRHGFGGPPIIKIPAQPPAWARNLRPCVRGGQTGVCFN